MPKIIAQTKNGDVSQVGIFIRTIILLAVLIFSMSIWGWWHLIYSNPKRVFWGMVDNALRTTSVSKETVQEGQEQTLNQKAYLITQPQQLATGKNEIKQTGQNGFDVITDVLGTPTADYVRYDLIKTSQSTDQGKPKDFKSILGVWGKTDTPNNQTSAQLYNQSVLGVLLFGNLNQKQRKTLTDLIQRKSVYKTDFGSVGRSIKNGRPVYTFEVKVQAEPYIAMLKQYGSFVGLNQFDKTNPADFRSTPESKFKFEVDVWTREIKKVIYTNGREERYSSFGAHVQPSDLPKNAIPINELQKRVQATQ